MRLVRVVLDRAAPAYDREYDYSLPDGTDVFPGCRVLVPFGTGNRERIALVLSCSEGGNEKTKQILSVLDVSPLLGEEELYLLRALHATTFCTWGDALHALIPPGAGMRLACTLEAVRGLDSENLSPDANRLYAMLLARKKPVMQDDILGKAGLTPESPALGQLLDGGFCLRRMAVQKRIADSRAVTARLCETEQMPKLTKKQRVVYDFLSQVGCATLREIEYYTGVTRAVADRLCKAGIIELYEQVVPRTVQEPDEDTSAPAPIVLSASQQRVYDDLLSYFQSHPGSVSLLYGVTGSGKTQVYLRLIEETLGRDRQVLVLVPEISLTPQTVSIFSRRFGAHVAVLHSSLSVMQRLDEWNRIRAGRADIVVGTRSAIFAPLDNIGLIVIDEEQEHTYHSEKSPRYHAREIARIRAKYHKANLLLCSATPSMESMAACREGAYHLARLTERFTKFGLPECVTIDLRTAPMAHGSTLLTEELCEALRETFERNEQAILLLNRRGYNTLVKCSACGETARCPNCSIPLAYHSANGRLVCHYCGYSRSALEPCEKCGEKLLRYTGAGTQRAEQELSDAFPSAKFLRLDADTTMSKFSHRDKFEAFSRGEYDCMVGTQMIAKGLDFPNVTLVGVLCADQSLYTEDFRGLERTFSLVTQVVGRSGRAEKPGRAVIQTYTPEHRVLQLAAKQDYDTFCEEELGFRRVGLYPPYCDLICVLFAHEDEQIAIQSAQSFARQFVAEAKNHPEIPLRLIGPAPCTPYRAAGRYRCRLLIKCRCTRTFRAFLGGVISAYTIENKAVYPAVDCYYDSNM